MDNEKPDLEYQLGEQAGFLLRKANQRHTAIFSSQIGCDLTPTQFSALARLYEQAPVSQNELGRQTAMDVATIKGVIDRLRKRGLLATGADRHDQRRILVQLTDEGRALVKKARCNALQITAHTLSPLAAEDRKTLIRLLKAIG